MISRRVEKGQRISAAQANENARAQAQLQSSRSSGNSTTNQTPLGPVQVDHSPTGFGRTGTIVSASNDTDVVLVPGMVASVYSQPYRPEGSMFMADVVLQLALPTGESDRLVAVVDNIPPGEVGRVMVLGVAQVRVSGEPGLGFATPDLEIPGLLVASSTGPFELFWEDLESPDTIRWALARFPVGGGGFNPPEVDKLPSIPSSGTWHAVYHKKDEQIWFAAAGDARWSPGWKWSALKGNPGA